MGRLTLAVDGWFRSGLTTGGRVQALSDWRVTCGSSTTATTVAGLLGGSPGTWETTASDRYEVLTDAPSVTVSVDGADCIVTDMRGWDATGLAHHCDGSRFLAPDHRKGTRCGCPETLADRKDHARSGRGPLPNTLVVFRLADAPDAGLFALHSLNWDFAEQAANARTKLTVGGRVGQLAIQMVGFASSRGRAACYQRLTLKLG